MKIAVVGAGISGLASAWLLKQHHEVTLFEAGDYIGGHTHTVDIDLAGTRFPSRQSTQCFTGFGATSVHFFATHALGCGVQSASFAHAFGSAVSSSFPRAMRAGASSWWPMPSRPSSSSAAARAWPAARAPAPCTARCEGSPRPTRRPVRRPAARCWPRG